MEIPCPNCTRRTECLRDRHCNNPQTPAFALRELEAARKSFEAASARLVEALKLVGLAYATETPTPSRAPIAGNQPGEKE